MEKPDYTNKTLLFEYSYIKLYFIQEVLSFSCIIC